MGNGLPLVAVIVAVVVAIISIALGIHFGLPDTEAGIKKETKQSDVAVKATKNHATMVDGTEYINGKIDEIIGAKHIMGNYSTVIHQTTMDTEKELGLVEFYGFFVFL